MPCHIDRVLVALAVVAEPVVESFHGTSLVLRLKPARSFPASLWSGTHALCRGGKSQRQCAGIPALLPLPRGIVPANRALESRRYCPCLGGQSQQIGLWNPGVIVLVWGDSPNIGLECS